MTPVSIFVVYIQNFSFSVTASFALTTSFFNETQFEHPLVLHLVLTRTTNLIQITDSAFVRAGPATSFFVRTRKNQSPTHPTGSFFPIVFSITFQTTKDTSFIFFYYSGSLICRIFANDTIGIWVSLIWLAHSSSIP